MLRHSWPHLVERLVGIDLSRSFRSVGVRDGFSCRLMRKGDQFTGKLELWDNDLYVEDIDSAVAAEPLVALVAEFARLAHSHVQRGTYVPTIDDSHGFINDASLPDRVLTLHFPSLDVRLRSASADLEGATWGASVAGEDWMSASPAFFDLFEQVKVAARVEEFVASLATESRHYLNAITDPDEARRDSHEVAGESFRDWWLAVNQFGEHCSEFADAVKASGRLLPTLFRSAAKSSLSSDCLSARVEQVLRTVESIDARVVRVSEGAGEGAGVAFRYANEVDEVAIVKDLEVLSGSVLELTKWVTTFRVRDQERKLIAEACAALHQIAPYVHCRPDTATATLIAGQPVMVAGVSAFPLEVLQRMLTQHS